MTETFVAQPLETGYWIDDDGRIHGPDGDTGYRFECQRVFGHSEHGAYRLSNRDIVGPQGFTGFFIDGNRIVGPSTILPWVFNALHIPSASPKAPPPQSAADRVL